MKTIITLAVFTAVSITAAVNTSEVDTTAPSYSSCLESHLDLPRAETDGKWPAIYALCESENPAGEE